MKRKAESRDLTDMSDNPSKVRILDDDRLLSFFQDATLEKKLGDILDLSSSNFSHGWIIASVFMRWPPRKDSGCKIQVISGKHRLDIEFHGKHIHLLDFEPHDLVKFSLKGASILPKKSTTVDYLPFKISYEEAVSLQYVDRPRKPDDNGRVLDIWQITEEELFAQKIADNDWFSTPRENDTTRMPSPPSLDELEVSDSPNAPPLSTIADTENREPLGVQAPLIVSEIGHPKDEVLTSGSCSKASLVSDQCLKQSTILKHSQESCENADDISVHGSGQDVQKRRKKVKKRDTRHNNQRRAALLDIDPQSSGSNQMRNVAADYTANIRLPKPSKKEKISRLNGDARRQTESKHVDIRNPALDLEAGFVSESCQYTALGNVKPNAVISIAGVVREISFPNQTKRREYTVTVLLIDPSNCSSPSGFRVNCFTKKYKEWLPNLTPGEVLLLRCVKVSYYQERLVGTVYSDKLYWAAFDPKEGKIHHSDLNGAPSSEILDDGFGPHFDPFYKPVEKELEYCLKLGEWWSAIQEQSSSGSLVQIQSRPPRQLRLIQDIDVNQFSDVAVYIAQLAPIMDDDKVGLTITDFTPHRLIRSDTPLGSCGLWCTSSRIDAQTKQQLSEGTYWRIKNIRLKIGANGFLEGDLFDVKWTRLDLKADAEDEPLRSLLQRQKEFEATPRPTGRRKHALISEVFEFNFCDLTVELLYCQHDDKFTEIYVTDYTKNNRVFTYIPERLRNTAGHLPVFKITCWGERSITRELEVGSYYALNNVRISKEKIDDGLKGIMNDCNEKIRKIRATSSDNAELAQLLSRKAVYLECPPHPSEVNAARTARQFESAENTATNSASLVRNRHYDQIRSSINSILLNRKFPNKFRLTARIVDYFPLDLIDFTVRQCMRCKRLIPKTRHACTMCEDLLAQYVQWIWLFFVRLEDDSGDQIDVSLANEGTMFLGGLEAKDLSTDDDCLQRLQSLMHSLTGNLIEVHKGVSENIEIAPIYGPYLDLAVASWQTHPGVDGSIVFGLSGCNIDT